MAIQTEIWARDIADALFPANAFTAQSISDDAWVNNKVVHLPQAGALPVVVRNRTSYPATTVQRTDTDATYNLDEFTSDPTHIADIEQIETSYDKRQSVLRDHTEQIMKICSNWLQYHWGATIANNILRTTGGNRAAQVTGATGTRKKLTLDDLILAKAALDDMDVPPDGRNILLPAFMYNDLMTDNKTTLLSMDISGQARMEKGELNMIFGFKIWQRGKLNLLSYTNAGTPVRRLPDAANLATANAAALCWHNNFVRRAKGSVKVYDDQDNPLYYGSIFSAMARLGGAKRYSAAETGVISIVEDAGV